MGVREQVADVTLPLAVALFRATGPAMNTAVAFYVAHWLGFQPTITQMIAATAVGALMSYGAVSLPGEVSFISSIAPIAMALGVPIAPLALLVAVEMVPLTVTVTNQQYFFVRTLERKDFMVYEDGVRQDIEDFSREPTPLTVLVLADSSFSMNGRRLAYAPDPSVVGQDALHMTDADGRLFGREINELARSHGSGWCDFKFLNPRTNRVEAKSVYIERVGDLVLGCGIYEGSDALAREVPTAAARLGASAGPYPRLATRG